MKNIFEIYTMLDGLKISGQETVRGLIDFLISKKNPNNFIIANTLKTKLSTNELPDPIKIVHLIGLIHQKEKESVKISQTNERSHFGIYYTDYGIAQNIAERALCDFNSKKEILNIKFLEPCVGIGMFVIAYIDAVIKKFKISSESELQSIINNIYCADIDEKALDIMGALIPAYIKYKHNLNIYIKKNNFYTGDLLFKIDGNKVVKNDPRHIFNVFEGFDIVLTNPPYKLLKMNVNKYEEKGAQYKDEVNKIIDFIKKEKIYKYNEGTLNLYKIFVEEIAENYTHKKGVFGLLIPTTILNDQQSEKLRIRIFKDFSPSTLNIIPEKNSFFPDISQAFCFFTVKKDFSRNKIEAIKNVVDVSSFSKQPITINKKNLEMVSSSFPIIIESEDGLKILNKLNKVQRISNYPSLVNLRGELDLTLNKEFITEKKTELPLLKGVNIGEFGYSEPNLYVKEEFLDKINGKKKYVAESRLVCQQISNMHSAKRLKFSIIPRNYILGNSCNFIALEDNLFAENNLSLYYLLGVLNSYLLDWRFRLSNSNNHISNYELFDLPILRPKNKERTEIEELAKVLEKNCNLTNLQRLNDKVFELYGLTQKEKSYIVSNYQELNEEIMPINVSKLELSYAL